METALLRAGERSPQCAQASVPAFVRATYGGFLGDQALVRLRVGVEAERPKWAAERSLVCAGGEARPERQGSVRPCPTDLKADPYRDGFRPRLKKGF